MSKLQAQLQCAKSLDLEQLAQHAAQSSGLAEAAAAAEGGAAPEKGRAAAAAPAHEAEQQDVGGQLQVGTAHTAGVLGGEATVVSKTLCQWDLRGATNMLSNLTVTG